jgi:hypothetical protein
MPAAKIENPVVVDTPCRFYPESGDGPMEREPGYDLSSPEHELSAPGYL